MQLKRNEFSFFAAGFTFIELMVVLLILSILMMLVLPTYQDSVRRARRAEAWGVLMKTMQQQERHYSVHGSYAAFSAAEAHGFSWHSGSAPESSAYEISAVACGEFSLMRCILLTAEPGTASVKHGYADKQCGTLTLNSAGVRTASGPGSQCW